MEKLRALNSFLMEFFCPLKGPWKIRPLINLANTGGKFCYKGVISKMQGVLPPFEFLIT